MLGWLVWLVASSVACRAVPKREEWVAQRGEKKEMDAERSMRGEG